MTNVLQKLKESKKYLLSVCPQFPKFAVVSGSGHSTLFKDFAIEKEISLGDIPNMPVPKVVGHVGKLAIGKLGATRVAWLQGRVHYFEGHKMEDVVFPYRLLAYSGAETFFLTNASGGLQKDMKPGDLVLVTDHLNMMGTDPLIGVNDPEMGTRFPDMTFAYDREINDMLLQTAKKNSISLRTGVYGALHGPSFETPAEIRMYRMLGADVVGMSTVPDVIALRHMNKRVVAISCVSNMAAGMTGEALDHESVLDTVKKSHPNLARLISDTINALGNA